MALIQYFKEQNIPDSEIVFSAVNLTKEFNSTYGSSGEITSNTFSGYSLTQSFKIESKDIKKIERVSRESTKLIEKEIELNVLNTQQAVDVCLQHGYFLSLQIHKIVNLP
jgi:hypothetical protein